MKEATKDAILMVLATFALMASAFCFGLSWGSPSIVGEGARVPEYVIIDEEVPQIAAPKESSREEIEWQAALQSMQNSEFCRRNQDWAKAALYAGAVCHYYMRVENDIEYQYWRDRQELFTRKAND